MSRLSRFAVNAAKRAAAKAAARTAATTERAAPSLSVPRTRSKPKPVVKALPAPPKPLALPAPGPGLPEFAAKPRGGQWWADREFEGINVSPEEAARSAALSLALTRWQPEGEGVTGQIVSETTPVQQWLERALTKYYKNEFGSPDDPLRTLAEQGLHYDQDMTPERWQRTVNDFLMEDRIGGITLPKHLYNDNVYPGVGDEFTTEVRMAMPWLAKLPVTDKLYGISRGGLDLSHFNDEFLNALNDAEGAGLPADLAVRPESLARMTFPQAVERVGRINQFRAKEMERAALDAQNNPVTHVFKEYADDNPMGLRWVEMAPPKGDGPTNYDVEEELRKALKYEGDTMGHCVGGYCPDVMEGRSRIFSLRDAKGEPHVTVETKPAVRYGSAHGYFPGFGSGNPLNEASRNFNAWSDNHDPVMFREWLTGYQPELVSAFDEHMASPDNIVQIKGKQNRAPKDDYLPFVQDFVKSQQWGNVGDLGNTGLVKLPDGRYITKAQYAEGTEKVREAHPNVDPGTAMLLNWPLMTPYFEGFAIGGRVDADRCFCRHPMSVRKKK